MKAAVLGATGYAGALLMRILGDHPKVASIIPVSRSRAGESLLDVDPGIGGSILRKTQLVDSRFVSYEEAGKFTPDVVFSALPHLASAELCSPFVPDSLVIDLSADLRHRDETMYREAYGRPRPTPKLQEIAVYGLSEWRTPAIASASIIANPGCYPTAALLPLLPLLRDGIAGGDIIINAMSGISGAGRKEKIDLLFCERTENVNAYSPGRKHRHMPEIAEQLGGAGSFERVLFTPHLVPVDQGMAVTTVAGLPNGASEDRIAESLAGAYGDKPFIRLRRSGLPETKHVRGTNRCDIGFRVVEDRVMLFSAIDNLWKGAAGQAIQNMNIRLGFEETAGLERHGEV
jgi:N-acetyl-gamma-glutamyl-phosphate reductase